MISRSRLNAMSDRTLSPFVEGGQYSVVYPFPWPLSAQLVNAWVLPCFGHSEKCYSNMEVQMCAPHTNFISFGHALGRETASSYGSFIFNFCGISTLFPTLVYIPASCVLRLLSPHLSAGTCCPLSLKQPFTLGFSVSLH